MQALLAAARAQYGPDARIDGLVELGPRRFGFDVLAGAERHRCILLADRDEPAARRELEILRRVVDAGVPAPVAHWAGPEGLVLQRLDGATGLDGFPEARRRVADDLGRALAALRELGLEHRNLRPEHVLVDEGGLVALLGWCRARPGDGAADQEALSRLLGRSG